MTSQNDMSGNHVGRLQELCQKEKEVLPKYEDISDNTNFRFKCSLKDWTTEGTGFNKKFAKHEAAYNMLIIFEDEIQKNLLKKKDENFGNKSAINKLIEYCTKEKKKAPVFTELPNDEGFYVCECFFEDTFATGKGKSKKNAKEKSANIIVEHFKINEYFTNLQKSEARKLANKNPVQELSEHCVKQRLAPPYYDDKIVLEGRDRKYHVTCKVGERQDTAVSVSKKVAKQKSAQLVLNLLKMFSPSSCNEQNNEENPSPQKRSAGEKLDEIKDEPPEKLRKSDF